jgi:L-ribulokinase
MPDSCYVLGVDFGTDSVRTIVTDAANGRILATSVFAYPRWKKGLFCNASINQFRQHPLDYTEGLEYTIRECLKIAGSEMASKIKAISVDTTGSTPVAVNAAGTPLALLPGFENNPNAMFVLWKDHTGILEAEQINRHAETFPINYLQFVGGIYSAEWFWAKLLHILRKDESVRHETVSWVEHCDWIPFLLTGGNDITKMKRGVCAAGHKALWAEAFGGFPPDHFFSSLDPLLQGFTEKMGSKTFTCDRPAGTIAAEWASKLGLPANVIIGVGGFDAHMGAVGAEIEPYHLSKVMGTSTCDMMVVPAADLEGKCIPGICGQVHGSIIPGMIGLEAGQSAFGDIYAWFRSVLEWPLKNLLNNSTVLEPGTAIKLQEEINGKIIEVLAEQAAALPINDNTVLAVDWMNGRRTPDANQHLKGVVANIGLGSDAPQLFYALVEATCFGAKAIVDRFVEEGIAVKGLIGLGGVANKSPFIMQLLADIIQIPIRIHKSEQTCALGAAMFAATAAGIYPDIDAAMAAMGSGFSKTYHPNPENKTLYMKRYEKYKMLGNLTAKTLHS